MPTIDRISGARIGGTMGSAGVEPATARVFAASPGRRAVLVPNEVVPLLAQAGIVPPPMVGEMLKRADVDDALFKSTLSVEQRLQVKNALRNVGLLAG